MLKGQQLTKLPYDDDVQPPQKKKKKNIIQ